jgi:hypothetical protein
MTDPSTTGACLCGGVRFELTEPARAAGYCHCTRCQRRTGTAASDRGSTAAHPHPPRGGAREGVAATGRRLREVLLRRMRSASIHPQPGRPNSDERAPGRATGRPPGATTATALTSGRRERRSSRPGRAAGTTTTSGTSMAAPPRRRDGRPVPVVERHRRQRRDRRERAQVQRRRHRHDQQGRKGHCAGLRRQLLDRTCRAPPVRGTGADRAVAQGAAEAQPAVQHRSQSSSSPCWASRRASA